MSAPLSPPARGSRAVRWALLLPLLLAGLLVGTAGPAAAHAILLSSSPASGATLADPPAEVTLTFDEVVTARTDAVSVLGPGGSRVAMGPTRDDGPRIRAAFPAHLAVGAYAVSWRVVSADGHVVGGTFTFGLGVPAPDAGASTAVSQPVSLPVTRAIGYLGLVLLGAAVALGALWPKDRRPVDPLLVGRAGAIVLAVGEFARLLALVPAQSGGGLASLGDSAAWNQTLSSAPGWVAGAHLVLLAIMLTLASWQALAVFSLGVVALWPFAGHSRVGTLWPGAVALDAIHLAAMALWLGGVLALLWSLRTPAGRATARTVLPRFSGVALGCIGLIAATGTLLALRQFDAWDELVRTSYGLILLAKIAGLAAIVGIAAVTRARVRRAAAPESLHRLLATEALVAVVVIGLAATLVGAVPGREAALPLDTRLRLAPGVTVHLRLSATRRGPVQAVLDTQDDAGHALALPEVDLRMYGPGLPAQLVTLHQESGDRYSSRSLVLAATGRWEAQVYVRTSAVDSATGHTAFTVRP
ncbi:MAG TPA: copper resistance protein CopC [Frankiaceae bacterium]